MKITEYRLMKDILKNSKLEINLPNYSKIDTS